MTNANKNVHFCKEEDTWLVVLLLKDMDIIKYMDGRKTHNGNLFKKVTQQM